METSDGATDSAVDQAPPSVDDRVRMLLSAARHVGAPGDYALVEAADPLDPIRVEAAGVGCGGGRRILLRGVGIAQYDGARPSAMLVRAVAEDGSGVLVDVRRGERGVTPWPSEGSTECEVTLEFVRLGASTVVAGVIPG